MANDPTSVINTQRQALNSSGLKFPMDGTLSTNWTCIAFYIYSRDTPTSAATLLPGTTIYLPVPFSGFEDNTDLLFKEEQMGALLGGTFGKGGLTQKVQAGLHELKREGLTTLAGIVGDSARNMAQQSIGQIANPNPSLGFDGVGLRTHNFSWRLVAKTPEESAAIDQIIYTLKTNALPSKVSGANYTLKYPNIAQINFSPKDIVKISQYGCFLEHISLKYDGDGHPAFFKNTGSPVIVDLSLTFRERTVLTADDYAAPSLGQ